MGKNRYSKKGKLGGSTNGAMIYVDNKRMSKQKKIILEAKKNRQAKKEARKMMKPVEHPVLDAAISRKNLRIQKQMDAKLLYEKEIQETPQA